MYIDFRSVRNTIRGMVESEKSVSSQMKHVADICKNFY